MTLLTQTTEALNTGAAGGSAARPARPVTAVDAVADAVFARLLAGSGRAPEAVESRAGSLLAEPSGTSGPVLPVLRRGVVADMPAEVSRFGGRFLKTHILQKDTIDSAGQIEAVSPWVTAFVPGLEGSAPTAADAQGAAAAGGRLPLSGAPTTQQAGPFAAAWQGLPPASRDATVGAQTQPSAARVGMAAAAPATAGTGAVLPGLPGSALPLAGKTLPGESVAATDGSTPWTGTWGMRAGDASAPADWIRGPVKTVRTRTAATLPEGGAQARSADRVDGATASVGSPAAPPAGTLTALLADTLSDTAPAHMRPAQSPMPTLRGTAAGLAADTAGDAAARALRRVDSAAATAVDVALHRTMRAPDIAVATGPWQSALAAGSVERDSIDLSAPPMRAAATARAPVRGSLQTAASPLASSDVFAADVAGEDGSAGTAARFLAGQTLPSAAPAAAAPTHPMADLAAMPRADVGGTSAQSAPMTDSIATAHPPVAFNGGSLEAGPLADRLIELALHGQQQAKLRLHPAELGALEVRIRLHDDGASVVISSPHGQVRDALEASLPRLRELFAAQGMNLVDVDVSNGGGHAPQGDGEALRHGAPRLQEVVGAREPAEPHATVGTSAQNPLRSHRIDLLA